MIVLVVIGKFICTMVTVIQLMVGLIHVLVCATQLVLAALLVCHLTYRWPYESTLHRICMRMYP